MNPVRARRRRTRQRGASSVEYALIALFVAVAIIGSVTVFGGRTADLFQRTCGSIAASQSQSC
jgi:Flp pilus assembly pilin Flp